MARKKAEPTLDEKLLGVGVTAAAAVSVFDEAVLGLEEAAEEAQHVIHVIGGQKAILLTQITELEDEIFRLGELHAEAKKARDEHLAKALAIKSIFPATGN